MRKVGLAGIIVLLLVVIISGVNYLATQGFIWNPSDTGFIYSVILTIGFLAAMGVGLLGALKENERFLIAGGVTCIVLALLGRFALPQRVYSWGFMDVILLLAGALMIVDRFHIKRLKLRRKEEAEKLGEVEPDYLLEELDKLEYEAKSEADREADLESARAQIYEVERTLLHEARKRPELVKPLRVRMYRRPAVQDIVKGFVDSDNKVIEPVIETGGPPQYPELSNIVGVKGKLQLILDNLVESGILQKDLYEKLIACPHCHKPVKVFLRNKCPKCGSHKTHLNRLMEHVKCGSIYKLEDCLAADGSLSSCPKCGKKIGEEIELKPVGVAFECEACRSAFSDPIRSFYCRSCNEEFELENCELIDTYSYMLNDGIRSEAKESLAVLTIADIIKQTGYKVKIPGVFRGRSGVSHEFTLTSEKGDKMIAIDLAMAGETVDMATVLSSYAKFNDIDAQRLLIAIPSFDKKAKGFLNANNISFLEGSTISELSEKVREYLEKANL